MYYQDCYVTTAIYRAENDMTALPPSPGMPHISPSHFWLDPTSSLNFVRTSYIEAAEVVLC